MEEKPVFLHYQAALDWKKFDIRTEGTTWDNLAEIFQKTGKKFVFVIDEWDAVFHMSFITQEDRKAYLLFLRSLLKGKVYVDFIFYPENRKDPGSRDQL